MPPRLRRRVEALRAMTVPGRLGRRAAGPTVDPGALTALAQACRDAERLRFAYTAADGTPHRPAGRAAPAGPARAPLVPGRLRPRPARLAQLPARPAAGPRPTGARFRPRELPAEDAAAFVRRGFEQLPATRRSRCWCRRRPPVVERRLGAWSRVEAVGEGSCRVTMHADQFVWPAFGLAQLDAEFSVVARRSSRLTWPSWQSGFS